MNQTTSTLLIGLTTIGLASSVSMFVIAIYVTHKAKKDVEAMKAKAAAAASEFQLFMKKLQDIATN